MKIGYKLSLLAILFAACLVIGKGGGAGDLRVFYEMANNACSGNFAPIYDTHTLLPFFYGPIALVVFSPFCLISYPEAIYASILFHSLSYVLFWFLLFKLYPFLATTRSGWSWFWIFVFAINPVHGNFQSQNIQLPLAASLLLVEALSQQSEKWKIQLAGVICSVAAMVKMFPFFLVAFYFISRPGPIRRGLIAGLGLSALLPLLLYGPENGFHLYRDFISAIPACIRRNSLTENPGVLNMPSLIATWFTWLGIASAQGPAILILQGFIALSFFVTAYRLRDESGRSQTHLWALALALMSVLNSSSRQDYFIFILPAFTSLMELWPVQKWVSRSLVFISLLMIAFTTQALVGRTWNVWLEMIRIPVVGMLLICGCLGIFLSLRSREPGSGSLAPVSS